MPIKYQDITASQLRATVAASTLKNTYQHNYCRQLIAINYCDHNCDGQYSQLIVRLWYCVRGCVLAYNAHIKFVNLLRLTGSSRYRVLRDCRQHSRFKNYAECIVLDEVKCSLLV